MHERVFERRLGDEIFDLLHRAGRRARKPVELLFGRIPGDTTRCRHGEHAARLSPSRVACKEGEEGRKVFCVAVVGFHLFALFFGHMEPLPHRLFKGEERLRKAGDVPRGRRLRADGVDVDVVVEKFCGAGAGEPHEPRVGRAVSGGIHHAHPRIGGDVDEAPAALLDHIRHGKAHRIERTL